MSYREPNRELLYKADLLLRIDLCDKTHSSMSCQLRARAELTLAEAEETKTEKCSDHIQPTPRA